MASTRPISHRPRPGRRRPARSFSSPPAESRQHRQELTLPETPFDPTPVAFSALGLDPRLLSGLADRRFTLTTPVQSATIPLAMTGADLVGCAQTGTGKTTAFLIPIIQRLLTSTGTGDGTRALVLAPTRELAGQIEDEFHGLAYHTTLSAAAVYGGVAAGAQERALKASVDLVVATPGRLLDHMGTGVCRFDGLEVLVLDEADRMLDMGFWPSVRRIVSALPKTRQTLLFSATLSEDVFRSTLDIMREPKMVHVGGTVGPATTISHHVHHVSAADKTAWLGTFLRRLPFPVLVFTRTKRGADRLARRLASAGVRTAALHADLTQSQRTAAVEGFKSGRVKALVATDIAARGLDVTGIELVINFDFPDSSDTYVHRVGRTGRAGAAGVAITLVTPEEAESVRALERSLNISLVPTSASEVASLVTT